MRDILKNAELDPVTERFVFLDTVPSDSVEEAIREIEEELSKEEKIDSYYINRSVAILGSLQHTGFPSVNLKVVFTIK